MGCLYSTRRRKEKILKTIAPGRGTRKEMMFLFLVVAFSGKVDEKGQPQKQNDGTTETTGNNKE